MMSCGDRLQRGRTRTRSTWLSTSSGGKIEITQAAEAQARTGHDFLPFYNWAVNTYAEQLEPMDDVVKAMMAQFGQYSPIREYLSKIKGSWRALPSSTGTLNLNCCARISLLKKHARAR
jgi:hypothetical protein